MKVNIVKVEFTKIYFALYKNFTIDFKYEI